ncbi:MAG: hypothetical protein K9N48_02120 [Verrucomicrobia bacterium]|nr:hypothetical protein [Verrucomicrobiota bacterium]
MKSKCVIYFLLAGLMSWGHAEVLPPEQLAPDDTLVLMTVPDYAQAKAVYEESPTAMFWNDQSMKEFKDKFMAQCKENVVDPLERELGVEFDNYKGLIQGQCTFALTSDGWEGWSDESDAVPGWLLILDSGANSEELKSNLEELKNSWVDSGKNLKTDQVQGVEVTTVFISSSDVNEVFKNVFGGDESEGDDTSKSEKTFEVKFVQSGSVLVVGNHLQPIEKVLSRLSGGIAPVLADVAAFKADKGVLRDSLCYGWVNCRPIIDAVEKSLTENSEKQNNNQQAQNMLSPKPAQIISALGLKGLKSLAMSVKEFEDGSKGTFFVGVPENQRSGLFKVFTLEQKNSAPPPFVPQDAVKFTRMRLNLQKAWASLETMASQINPGLAGMLQMMIDNVGKEQGFSLRKSVIGNLGDDFVMYQKNPKELTLEGLNSPPSISLLGSSEPETLAQSIKQWITIMSSQGQGQPGAGGPSIEVKERDFLGRKIYSIPTPGMSAQGGAGSRSFNFAAAGGYIGLTADASMIEEYLRLIQDQPKSLRDVQGLQEAAQEVGGMNTGMFGYENQKETVRVTIEVLKQNKEQLEDLFKIGPFSLDTGDSEETGGFSEWVDLSLLPPFERIQKYFYFTVYGLETKPDGLHFQFYSPKPPALN